ncbi:MAG: ATP-dependent Clp protease proteolytic subunit [Clostridia bacterium]|nr:ATP-dependent Clp protease proteolytic subunit [Clostridia bacterium]
MIANPTFFENEGGRQNGYDLFSRLLKDRIILLFNEVNDDLACSIVAQLLFLEAQDPEKDITLYINSPGGSVSAGFAIYDTMRSIKCDVSTVCVGSACSMGAFLLAAGTKGKRYALENSEIMLHQVIGSAGGQASDVIIAANFANRTKERINRILSENIGRPYEEIVRDTERDNWMFAEDALAYGVIDEIVKKK